MQTRIFIYSFLCLHCCAVIAQHDIKKYVQQHAIPIATISPDSANFDDLESIGKAIGDSRVVMLGELDHGDAPTFLAKTRLVKYLHQKKNFTVLALESDFFGLVEGLDNTEIQKPGIDSLLKNNVLSLWAYCNTCSDLLYDYIPLALRSEPPLNITGFDNQTSYSYSRTFLVQKLDSVLQHLNLPIAKRPGYHESILPLLKKLVTRFWFIRPDKKVFTDCDLALRTIRSEISRLLPANDFWLLVIDNLISFNSELQYLKKDRFKAYSIRDMQMYLNLKWLVQVRYPNEKIIVWAANTHVAKYSGRKYVRMGKLFSDDSSLKSKPYIIGFTTYAGESGRLGEKKYNIPPPPKNSFENWIPATSKYAFVDFTEYNRQFSAATQPFHMRGLMYSGFKDSWEKVYNGMFYIKAMYPCERNQLLN